MAYHKERINLFILSKRWIAVLILGVILLSCSRSKNKVKRTVDKAKDKIQTGISKATDQVFPQFDPGKPDTENNKKRFQDFLHVDITPDVKNIYCFSDNIGIDADYMFAFSCNDSTSKKIITANHLSIDSTSTDNGFSMQHDFEWWNKKRIAELQKYSWTDGKSYFKYYWYDSVENKGYFFDFDM